jgi:lipopolysaccharide/colanic/teichoic acid biosynthesis glycosyltransferase
MLKKWDNLPEYMRTDVVRPYYDKLKRKRLILALKRIFDFTAAIFLLMLLAPVIVGVSIAVAADLKGTIIFRQERVTQYGRKFKILKFRTMIANAEQLGSQITVSEDARITRTGKVLRKYRLDELPQLINIILGDMSFCGTRPEVPRFVYAYTPEMMATLLIPAGLTSEASIQYKDEDRLLREAEDIDEIYIRKILPEKMKYNLQSIKEFSFRREIGIMVRTIMAVFR